MWLLRGGITDDLACDDMTAAVIDPDFAALVGGRGIMPVSGQELPGRERHLRHSTRGGNPVHVDIRRRQKNADLLPGTGRGGVGHGIAGNQHAAIGRGDDALGARRVVTVRIPKEKQKDNDYEEPPVADEPVVNL